jgi:hypothetical protein
MLELLLPDTSKAQRDELAKKESELYQKKYLPAVRPFAGVAPYFGRPNRLASRSVWSRPASRSMGPGQPNPRFQSGLRYSPTKDIDFDVIYGRNLLGEWANWITVGIMVRIGDN